MFNVDEFERWFRSAKLTLQAAYVDLEAGNYNWVCFKCQQAVEKALKALLWGLGNPMPGHSLKKLVEKLIELGVDVPKVIHDYCVELSKYYTITRYPNMWESGVPEEYFTKVEAEEAIKKTESVLSWVEKTWRELLRGEEKKD